MTKTNTARRIANAPILCRENGCGMGWNWASCLSRNVDELRKAYRALRTAYLALPTTGEHVNGGATGRDLDTADDFDASIRETVGQLVAAWGGERAFDRLTVGQLFVMEAASELKAAATRRTFLAPSPETMAWTDSGGETLHFGEHGDAAIDAALAG